MLDTFAPVCSAPEPAFTSDIQGNSVRLNWTKPIEAVAYEIKGREVGKPWITIVIGDENTTHKDINILNLNTSYEWKIRTFCDSAYRKSEWTPVMTFSTPASFQRLANNGTQLNKNETADEIVLYPNPTEGIVHLKIPVEMAGENLSIQLYDLKGRCLYMRKYFEDDYGSIELFIADLPEGVYHVLVKNSRFLRVEKIIIAR